MVFVLVSNFLFIELLRTCVLVCFRFVAIDVSIVVYIQIKRNTYFGGGDDDGPKFSLILFLNFNVHTHTHTCARSCMYTPFQSDRRDFIVEKFVGCALPRFRFLFLFILMRSSLFIAPFSNEQEKSTNKGSKREARKKLKCNFFQSNWIYARRNDFFFWTEWAEDKKDYSKKNPNLAEKKKY